MIRRQFLSSAFALIALTGCGSDLSDATTTPAPVPIPPETAVISASQAAARISTGQVLVLAAESVLESAPAPLLANAIRVDVDALTRFSETPGALDDLLGFQQLFRSWGVQEQPIVIYDDGEMKFAARVHFLLQHFGAPPSFLVNGGAPALAPLVPGGGGNPRSSTFQARVRDTPVQLVFQQQVLAALNTGVKIVDVRTPAEFAGQLLLPGDARPGHIPGAVNVPIAQFFDSQGLVLPNEELVAVFQRAGLRGDDSVIVYCHDGAKSALGSALLAQCGYRRVSLYYLSYRDWSQNAALPVQL